MKLENGMSGAETNKLGIDDGQKCFYGDTSYTGRTRLMLILGSSMANKKISEVLGLKISDFWAEHCTLRYFMQDNARPHVARTGLEGFRSQYVPLLEWPDSSIEPH